MRRTSGSVWFCVVIASAYLLAGLGCSSKLERPEQEGPINLNTALAIAGDDYITLQEAFAEYVSLSAPGRSKEANAENAVQEAIYRSLAWQRIDGYKDYDPKQVHRLAQSRWHEPLVNYMMQEVFKDYLEVADSSIDSFYQANLEAYTAEETRLATHILISDNPKAWLADGEDVSGLSQEQLESKVKRRINELYQQVKSGEDLAELAEKYSHDSASKKEKGSLGYFGRGRMVPEFEEVVFSLKEGEISKPFKTQFGYHIVRVDDIREKETAPLNDELRESIRQGLLGMIRRSLGFGFIDSLGKAAEYEWNMELLQKEVGDYDPHDWVCIVNGTDTVEALMLREKELRYRTSKRVAEVSIEERKDLVLGQINPYLLNSAAKELGYASSDTMQQVYDHFRRLEIRNRIFNDRTRMEWEPSEEEMQAYYEEHVDDYKSDQPVKVKHIIFEDSSEAVQALAEIRAGADFDSTALKLYPGDDDIKKIAYDLGWISREEMGVDFFNAAWLTAVGEITEPVRTSWGYHLIKVVDRKPMLDYEGARLAIKRQMLADKRQELEENWIDWLTDGKQIEVFDDIISQIDFRNQDYYRSVTDSLEQAAVAADSTS